MECAIACKRDFEGMTLVEERPEAAHSRAARKAMIDSQLRVSGVNAELVIERMGTVARENYVPESAKGHAYMDRSIALDNGRKLPAPLVHGMLLQEAAPQADDKVLLVESGSGYLAELLKPVAAKVESITPGEAVTASRKRGEFTLLVIEGAVEQVPEGLANRLEDGARIVTGIAKNGVTRLATGRKLAGEIALLPLIEIGIPELPEFASPKGWSF
jgi:protein-L-isoaspartate(D-aspartate) O-methyltransferase